MQRYRKALCACGSGASFRDCCAPAARADRLGWRLLGEPPRPGPALEAWPAPRRPLGPEGLKAWEADFLGEGGIGGRRSLALVMAGTSVLAVRELSGQRGEAGRLAALEATVLAAADAAGAFPEELRLRDAALAGALAERLARHGVRCRHDLGLYGVDGLAADLRRLLDPQPAARPGRGR